MTEAGLDAESECAALRHASLKQGLPPARAADSVPQPSSTFRISGGCTPRAIFAEVFEFFCAWLEDARVEERNEGAFSIGAAVRLRGSACRVQVQVYTLSDRAADGLPVYAIEFRRRDGDGSVFRNVYAEAERHITYRLQKSAPPQSLCRDRPLWSPPSG